MKTLFMCWGKCSSASHTLLIFPPQWTIKDPFSIQCHLFYSNIFTQNNGFFEEVSERSSSKSESDLTAMIRLLLWREIMLVVVMHFSNSLSHISCAVCLHFLVLNIMHRCSNYIEVMGRKEIHCSLLVLSVFHISLDVCVNEIIHVN